MTVGVVSCVSESKIEERHAVTGDQGFIDLNYHY